MTNESPQHRLANMRYSNTQGKIIPMHHAFLTVQMDRFSRVSAILMPPIFLVLLWLLMPAIMQLWGSIFQFWMGHIYQGSVDYAEVRILGHTLIMPYPLLDAIPPSIEAIYLNLAICVIVFLLTFIVPARIAPMTYMLRATLLIQASASIDRLISPDNFPYTLKIYLLDSLSLSIYMVFLLPVVLGFIYFIFDFGLWRKVTLTLLMLAYYFLTIPCQYMFHAFIIHEWTLLFLPVMYLMFGTLLNVLTFVSIYAFGMSWRSDQKTMNGRGL